MRLSNCSPNDCYKDYPFLHWIVFANWSKSYCIGLFMDSLFYSTETFFSASIPHFLVSCHLRVSLGIWQHPTPKDGHEVLARWKQASLGEDAQRTLLELLEPVHPEEVKVRTPWGLCKADVTGRTEQSQPQGGSTNRRFQRTNWGL